MFTDWVENGVVLSDEPLFNRFGNIGTSACGNGTVPYRLVEPLKQLRVRRTHRLLRLGTHQYVQQLLIDHLLVLLTSIRS